MAAEDVMYAQARIWRHVQPGVERHAHILARDRDERDELIQAARLELWRIDPSRCDVTNRDDVAYLREMPKHNMSREAAARSRAESAGVDYVPLDIASQLRAPDGHSAED